MPEDPNSHGARFIHQHYLDIPEDGAQVRLGVIDGDDGTIIGVCQLVATKPDGSPAKNTFAGNKALFEALIDGFQHVVNVMSEAE